MKKSTNKELIDFAKRVIRKNPKIDVLNKELLEQYSPLIRCMDIQLKKKNDARKLLLPELGNDGNESIAIFSDYGGEAADSKYFTYTFLVCGWNHSYGLKEAMDEIREKHNLKDKEISFKDFGYGPIQRALDEYLRALDMCVIGLLYTVVVEKEIVTFFDNEDKSSEEMLNTLKENGFGEWKPKVAEKLARVVHIASYLVSLLSKDGQKILWMTDHDAIAPNQEQHEKMMKLFQSVLTIYTNNKFELIGGALPFEDRSIQMLDLLSAADIAAGSIEHYFTRNDKMDDLTIKEEANKVLKWLGRDGLGLKKHTIIIRKNGNAVDSGEVEFTENEPSTDREFIEIPL